MNNEDNKIMSIDESDALPSNVCCDGDDSLWPETLSTDLYDVGGGYGMTFVFKYIRQSNGDIHIHIIDQPPYRPGQKAGSQAAYLRGLPNNPYIFHEPMPRTKDEARKIAAKWARCTAYCIRHGK